MIQNKAKPTIVLGLTGSMAAGKSTVSRRLRALGATVIDADEAARQAVEPGTPGLRELARAFGPGILLPDGGLDRRKMAALAFQNPAALQTMNGILHPLIRQMVSARLEGAKSRGERVAVLDVPLLFESGWQRYCDKTWLVAAPEALRLERAMARSGMGREEALARMAAQMPEAEKIALADVVIHNDGTLDALYEKVDALYQNLEARD